VSILFLGTMGISVTLCASVVKIFLPKKQDGGAQKWFLIVYMYAIIEQRGRASGHVRMDRDLLWDGEKSRGPVFMMGAPRWRASDHGHSFLE
jgi:hypothetical protein